MDLADHAAQAGCRVNDPIALGARTDPAAPRRRTPWWIWTTAAGAIIGAALYYSAPARAESVEDYASWAYPVVCDALDESPTVSIAIDTGSYEFAGGVVGVSVRDYCPWNRPPVERFIAVYAPAGTLVA